MHSLQRAIFDTDGLLKFATNLSSTSLVPLLLLALLPLLPLLPLLLPLLHSRSKLGSIEVLLPSFSFFLSPLYYIWRLFRPFSSSTEITDSYFSFFLCIQGLFFLLLQSLLSLTCTKYFAFSLASLDSTEVFSFFFLLIKWTDVCLSSFLFLVPLKPTFFFFHVLTDLKTFSLLLPFLAQKCDFSYFFMGH